MSSAVAASGWVQADPIEMMRLHRAAKGTAPFLYLYLVWRSNGKGKCWPSMAKIADDLGVSKNAVRTALARLESLGAIRIDRGGMGREDSHRYYPQPLTGLELPDQSLGAKPFVKRPIQSDAASLKGCSQLKTSVNGSLQSTEDFSQLHEKGSVDCMRRVQLTEPEVEQRNITREVEQMRDCGAIDAIEPPHPAKSDPHGKVSGPPPAPTFQEFWDAYGYKKSRKEAERTWKGLSAGSKRAALAAVPAYLADIAKTKTQQKHAQGWLNGRRWEDELSAPSAGNDAPPELPTTHDLPDGLTPRERVWLESYRKNLTRNNGRFADTSQGYPTPMTEAEFLAYANGELFPIQRADRLDYREWGYAIKRYFDGLRADNRIRTRFADMHIAIEHDLKRRYRELTDWTPEAAKSLYAWD